MRGNGLVMVKPNGVLMRISGRWVRSIQSSVGIGVSRWSAIEYSGTPQYPVRVSEMMLKSIAIMSRAVIALGVGTAVSLTGTPAQARVFIGIGIPFYGPAFYPPPVYYPPPPVYYAPPVVYAPPPAQTYTPGPAYGASTPGGASGGGQLCYAGPYVCPMERPVATGGSCYCLGNGGERVTGRAN
jgi:hypothetical protein